MKPSEMVVGKWYQWHSNKAGLTGAPFSLPVQATVIDHNASNQADGWWYITSDGEAGRSEYWPERECCRHGRGLEETCAECPPRERFQEAAGIATVAYVANAAGHITSAGQYGSIKDAEKINAQTKECADLIVRHMFAHVDMSKEALTGDVQHILRTRGVSFRGAKPNIYAGEVFGRPYQTWRDVDALLREHNITTVEQLRELLHMADINRCIVNAQTDCAKERDQLRAEVERLKGELEERNAASVARWIPVTAPTGDFFGTDKLPKPDEPVHCGGHVGTCERDERGRCKVMLRLIDERERERSKDKQQPQHGAVVRCQGDWED